MPPPAADRLSAADVTAVLERFGGHDLLAQGAVNIISLAAIRDRAGERWPRKRDDVWAYVDRRLAEHLTFQDLAQRIGETDYLIAMTSESGVAAQAAALKVLEEVLMHFLGAAQPRDLSVRAVTALSGDEVICAPLDPVAIQSRRPIAASASPLSAPKPAVDPAEEKRRNPYIFSTAAGLPLRIDFAVETVVALRLGVTAALRIEPTVSDRRNGRVIPTRSFSKLSDIDLAVIDQAVLDYTALYLPQIGGPDSPALVAPLSFRTLGTSKGRQALMACGDSPEKLKTGLVIELIDLDAGTPGSRLIEVCGLLKTICRGVFARMQPGSAIPALLKDARLMGISLDAYDLRTDEKRMAAQMLDFGRQVRGLAQAVSIHGLPSEVLLAVAETAGATHAALRAPPVTVERPAA